MIYFNREMEHALNEIAFFQFEVIIMSWLDKDMLFTDEEIEQFKKIYDEFAEKYNSLDHDTREDYAYIADDYRTVRNRIHQQLRQREQFNKT